MKKKPNPFCCQRNQQTGHQAFTNENGQLNSRREGGIRGEKVPDRIGDRDEEAHCTHHEDRLAGPQSSNGRCSDTGHGQEKKAFRFWRKTGCRERG